MAKLNGSAGVLTDPQIPVPIEAPDVTLEPGQVIGERYEVLGRLGAGGMGFVFRAHDRRLSEDIAVKIVASTRLDDSMMFEKLRQEAKLARKIAHRNVCKVFDYVEADGLRFLTMEFIEGRNLRAFLREGALSSARVVEIVEQVAAGLSAVHLEKMVHRDVKPENIVLRATGEAVLVDFGLARNLMSDHKSEFVAGTPAYMSPEQLRGEPNIDGRSDIFALGIVAYELLTGFSPFAHATSAATASAILRDPPRPFESQSYPKEITSRIEKVLLRAMAKSPADRFSSPILFAQALARALDGSSEEIQIPDTAPLVVRGPFRRVWLDRRRRFLAIAVPVLLLTAAVFNFLRRNLPSDREVSLVVVPFENATHDPSRDRLGLEATEAVRKELKRLSHVRILSAPNVERAREMAADEGARWILVGDLHFDQQKTRLSAHFENAQTHENASVGIAVDVSIPKDVEESLDQFKARVLHEARLLDREYERFRRAESGTVNDKARELLVQYYQNDYTKIVRGPTEQDMHRAKALLDETIEADPLYAEAFVERAYLLASGGTPKELLLARQDIDLAAKMSPIRPAALIMRCRVMQVALLQKDSPTDEEIKEATEACDAALKIAPSSAEVHIVFARLHNLQCNDVETMKSLENIPDEDFGLSGRAWAHQIYLMLDAGDVARAEKASILLLRFEEEQRRLGKESVLARAGIPPVLEAHLLRAGVLKLIGQKAEARNELEKQLEWLSHGAPNPKLEAAAMRGILHGLDMPSAETIAKYGALLKQHEDAIAQEIEKNPYVAIDAAGHYQWVDPLRAVEWIELAQKSPKGLGADACNAWLRIADFQRTAGKPKEARAALERCKPQFAWEQRCFAWIDNRVPK